MEYAEIILSIVTLLVSIILGFVSKKIKWFNNKLIPLQNLLIGIIVALVYWAITKDLSLAISLSGVLAGGVYDIPYNFLKFLQIIKVEQEVQVQEE